MTVPTTTSVATKKPTRTISPFYYGLNYQRDKTSTKTATTSTSKPIRYSAVSTTKSPYVFGHYFSTSTSSLLSKKPAVPFSTTTTSPTTTSTMSTRNPVFDVYLKRLASTTKSPYNFENFAQYFKTSSANPKYAYNLFGAHSNTNATMIAAEE